MDISYFQKINNTYHSQSKQETDLYVLNNHVNNHFADTIGYHHVKKNNNDFELIISKTASNSSKKKIKSRPNIHFELGDYIEWKNHMWIVVEKDNDDKTYLSGVMQLCNHKLRWQNLAGKIIERWAVINNASKYATGEKGNATIMLPDDSFLAFLQIDEETIQLQRGQKFFLDYNLDAPTVYELTRPEPLTYVYDDLSGKHYGYSNWIMKEKEYTPTKDEINHWVVGWKDISPTLPVRPDNPNQSTILLTINSPRNCIKIGDAHITFKGIISDKDGKTTKDVGVFSINSCFTDKITSDTTVDNQIKIKIADEYQELIGQTFELVFSNKGNTESTKIVISIEENV